jgi:hypothetical protein
MSTRRQFLGRTAAATGLLVAAPLLVREPAQESTIGAGTATRTCVASRASRKFAHIKSLARRDETILRLGGWGDCYHMSWASNDQQYVSVNDGMGWLENRKADYVYNTRLWTIDGGPRGASFHEMATYPGSTPMTFGRDTPPRYYNFGMLALDSRIYQFLCTMGGAGDEVKPVGDFIGAKLIYSPDNGQTWCNQDGSPLVWEPWGRRSRDTMVFYHEPQEAFSLLSVLQMGRNYEDNRDGYVYVYAPNGNTEGTMNELVMFRVRKDNILNRRSYEYFAGRRSDGSAVWVKEISARTPVHTFPRGWVNNDGPLAWNPSVVYNAPLKLYMMANWATGCSPEGKSFAKPSYLGFWTAANPWGPWYQIHEETAWTPAKDFNSRAYESQIAPKWIAADGKSFWLVWSDYQHLGADFDADAEYSALEAKPNATRDEMLRFLQREHQHQPYYSFNVQRVDLTVA